MNLTSSVALNLNCAQTVKLYKKNYNHFVQGIFCHFFSKLNLVHNVIVRNCSKSLYCDDELEHFDILLNKTSFSMNLDYVTNPFPTAGYYGFAPKSSYEPSKNYFPGPPGRNIILLVPSFFKHLHISRSTGPGKQDGSGLPPAHYQGYEAALFNAAHAYLHHQSGPKAPQMGGGGMPGNKAGHGGQGGPKSRVGRYFRGGGGGDGGGGFNQRWTSSSTQQLHYCEVCKISCASK